MRQVKLDRKFLTEDEVNRLAAAAKEQGRNGDRDRALVLVMWRHGLRASEVGLLRWDRIDFKAGEIWISRLKNGRSGMQPIWPDERKALLKLQKKAKTPYIFETEQGNPLARRSIDRIVSRAGQAAGFAFNAHPHMLRHACGYYHANKGADIMNIQKLLGHVDVRHTVYYSQLAPGSLRQLLD